MNIDEFIPDLPQPGWSGRREAIVVALIKVVAGAVILLGAFYAIAVYGAALS